MPIYEVTAPNGKVYEVEGPAGASRDQLVSAVRRRLLDAEVEAAERQLEELRAPRPAPPPETTLGGNVKEFFKGIPSGAANFVDTVAAGASAPLSDEAENATRGGIGSLTNVVRAPLAAAPGYEDSVGRRLGEGLGSYIPPAVSTLLGPLGWAAGIGMTLASGAGEARIRAEQEGATPEQRAEATGWGAPLGLLDLASPGVGQAVVGQLRRILMAGGIEAATEASQAIAQNLIAKGVYKPQQEVLEGAAEEGAYGGAVGALAQALMDAILPRRRGGAGSPDEPLPEAPEAPPPGVVPPGDIPPPPPPPEAGLAGLTPAPPSAPVVAPAPEAGLTSLVAEPVAPAPVAPAPTDDVEATNAALREVVASSPPPGVDTTTPFEQPESGRRVDALQPGETVRLKLQGQEREFTVQANDGQRVQGTWDDGRVEAIPKARLAALLNVAEVKAAAPAQTDGPAPGMVRLYHGGVEPDGGPRWVTPDLKYARGYAAKSENGGVYFVDVPSNDPRLQKAFDDSGTSVTAPIAAFNAPDDISSRLRPLVEEAVAPVRQDIKDVEEERQRQARLEEEERAALTPPEEAPDAAVAPAVDIRPDDGVGPGRGVDDLAGTDRGADGDGAPDRGLRAEGQPPAAAPARTEAPAADGLGDVVEPVGVDQAGDGVQPPALTEPDYEAAKAKAAKQAADAEAGTVPVEQAYAEGKETAERGGGAEVNPYGDTSAGEAWTSGFIETKFPNTKKDRPESESPAKQKTERAPSKSKAPKEPTTEQSTPPKTGETEVAGETETETAETEPTKQRAPAGRVEPTGPTATAAKAARADSDERGLTEEIEEAFADGSTVAQVQEKLGKKKLGFLFPDQRPAWLTGVRSTLGIPFRTTPAGKKQFDSWKADYDARQRGESEPSAAKKERAAAVKKADSGRTLVEPAKLAKANHSYVAAADGSVAKSLEYLGHDIASSTIDPADNPGNAQDTLNKLTDAIQAKSVPAEMFKFGKASEEFPGMRGKFAKEFYNSLTPEGRLELAKKVAEYMRVDIYTTTVLMPDLNTQLRLKRDTQDQAEGDAKATKKDSEKRRLEAMMNASAAIRDMQALSQRDALELADLGTLLRPLHPHAQDLLAAGNLRGALMVVAETDSGMAGRVARQLAGVMGTTTVKIEKGLTNEAGRPVPALFDPKTNTITLDSADGMNSHALLHEATHAATHATLRNPSHPLTKQLQKLFDDVKGQLDTAYGAQSLDEFAAEAFSNPEFQQKLSSMRVDGSPNTAWNRFTRAVANFVRRLMGLPTKPMDSAMDRADNLISAILAPAPASIDAGVLYAGTTRRSVGSLFGLAGKRAAERPEFSRVASKIRQAIFESPKEFFKQFGLSTLPSNSLAELAKPKLPMAGMFDVLIEKRKGAESKRNAQIEAQVRYMREWATANQAEYAVLMELTADTTLNQVDASKDASEYAGQRSVNVNGREVDKEDTYAEMRPKWDKLSPQGRATYKQIRDGYAKLYDDIKRVVMGRIEDELGDREAGLRAVNAVWEKLLAKANLDPYFALYRRGNYWLSYNIFNPGSNTTEHIIESFETVGDRKYAADFMRKNGATDITNFAQIKEINFRNAPPTSFVNDVLKTLGEATATKTVTDPVTGKVTKEQVSVSDKTTDEILQLFLTSLPETAFAQSFRARKGTPGFVADPIQAFHARALNISHQLGALEYAPKLNKLHKEMTEHVKRTGQDEVAAAYLREYAERIKLANNPSISPVAQMIRSLGFGWTLGFNVSSALVNTSQVPLVVIPVLGGTHGFIKATQAVSSATRIFMGSGFNRDIEMLVPATNDAGEVTTKKIKTRAAPSLDNYDFDDPNLPAHIRELKPLMELAMERGQLNRSLTYDILAVDENDSTRTKISAMSGIFMHHAERMNRQITMIAAYKLKLDQMRADKRKIDAEAQQEAAEHALYMTDFTNGSTTAASAPRIAQNNLGSIMFMYKKYGVAMYAMMAKTAHQLYKGETPEIRRAAMKQLVGIFGASAAMAGVKGIPMFGVAMMVFNLFLDEDEDDAETLVRKYVGETLYSGAINEVTGIDVASRIGLSDLIFREQRTPEAENAIQGIINQLGGPVLGSANRVANGVNLVNQGFVQRGIEQMLPASISSAFKAFRYGDEGVLTLRGDPITEDLNFGNLVAQSLGFAPADYIAQLEKNADLKGIERASVQERTKLLRTFYVASRTGDTSTMQDALDGMMKFNRKHPTAAITGDTIKRSMAQHAKTSAEMYNGVTLNKALRPELYGLISEYGDEE